MLLRLLLPVLLLLSGFGVRTEAASPGPRRPNFLVILADDLGFSDLGCYGGEIRTPNLDRLARGGLRFTQFYNTARCWPTRSALMTGYYPQEVRMDPPQGRLPAWAVALPRRLAPLGYRCYQSGKWHVSGAPRVNADAGFDHSYVLEDHDRNFYPRRIVEDDVVRPPVATNAVFYTSSAFADHAIRCLREHADRFPGRPFFAYLAFTVPHFPLHAPAADIDRYRDVYLAGWDAVRERRWQRLRELGVIPRGDLPPREESAVPYWNLTADELRARLGPGEIGRPVAWSALDAGQQRFQATKMAIHAAMIDRMDHEIGRVLEQVKAMGAEEDTVVFFASDNGASAEQLIRGDGHDPAAPPGSAGSFLCLGPGWSTAANAPFRRHKSWVNEGGIATPLIVHWPGGIAASRRGGLRRDPGHVVDFVPTLLDLARGPGERSESEGPALQGAPPLPGRSLVPAFAGDGRVRHEFLYFHHDQNRALRIGDWKLVAGRPNTNAWELFDLRDDRTECHDLSDRHPERVRAMAGQWEELERRFRAEAAR